LTSWHFASLSAILRTVVPQPEIYDGPILPDLGVAGGIGMTLGGVVGFFFASLVDAIYPADPVKVGGYGAGLLGVFGVWLVLWSRIWP
jgi:hypothetical protein